MFQIFVSRSSCARMDFPYGVPQGSNLGPLHFFNKTIRASTIKLHCYADDAQFYIVITTYVLCALNYRNSYTSDPKLSQSSLSHYQLTEVRKRGKLYRYVLTDQTKILSFFPLQTGTYADLYCRYSVTLLCCTQLCLQVCIL